MTGNTETFYTDRQKEAVSLSPLYFSAREEGGRRLEFPHVVALSLAGPRDTPPMLIGAQ